MNNSDSINRSYRMSDINRWQSMDFVVGYTIHRSNNPSKDCDLCSILAGDYPKSFNWSGWHDKCKCYATAILMDDETSKDQEVSDLKAALRGTERIVFKPKNAIEHIPQALIDWFLKNRASLNSTNTFPDFVTNNMNLLMSGFQHYYNNKSPFIK